jgi:dTDP-4-amino-4,6-dideoxygalactose transaminase
MNLAINGGVPLIQKKFKKYNPIGEEERRAVDRVMTSGVLSRFVGGWGKDFNGGEEVQTFEKEWAETFSVKHAIAVNSWTSGLICAVGAIGIEPGDEVIVTPWTMCASATAILHWGGIPVFADISFEDYCLDPQAVRSCITPKTKAIMSVDIFGGSANMNELAAIANEFGLKIISDTAQAPGAAFQGKLAGTIADIGGYSLNYHKHIHTGEGGVVVTNNDELALKVRLIRNHAEAAVAGSGLSDISNMIGYNFRLGEIESAIGREQLRKIKLLLAGRVKTAKLLIDGLSTLPGLHLPELHDDSDFLENVYYVLPMQLDDSILKIANRDDIVDAITAEGVDGLMKGYTLVYQLPIFQQKKCYGKSGFPWIINGIKSDVSYEKGICPNAEKLHKETFIGYEVCLFDLTKEDIDLIVKAFEKVWIEMRLKK